MGMLKRMKDMKDMANAAPGMVQQAQHLGAQAQMAAAHQAAAQAQLTRVQGRLGQLGGTQVSLSLSGPDFEPVAAATGLANGASVRRTVMITSMRQVGMINFDLLVEFELTVMADGMPPYPATMQQPISQMQIGQLRPGLTLQASVDAANPATIWLDLTSIR